MSDRNAAIRALIEHRFPDATPVTHRTAEPVPEGTETVRLSRAAREGGVALVTLTTHASMASLRVTSQILRETYRWRKTPFGDPAEAQEVMIRVRARSLGWNRSADFPVPVVPYDLRMSLEPGVVDRRGVRYGRLRTADSLLRTADQVHCGLRT